MHAIMDVDATHIALMTGCFVVMLGHPVTTYAQSPTDESSPSGEPTRTDTSRPSEAASSSTTSSESTSGDSAGDPAPAGNPGNASSSDDATADANCPEKATIPGQTSPDQYTLMGVACFKAKQYALAYTYYRRAYDETPSPLLTAAIGRSLHKLGIYHLAKHYYRRFLETDAARNRETAASADKIRQRLSQLQRDIRTHGRKVRLTSVPADARVSIPLSNGDWIPVGRTPATLMLAPGKYRFAFEHPDFRGRIRSLDLQQGDHADRLHTTLFHREAAFQTSGATWRRRGFITSLASIPLIATSGMLFGLSQSTYSSAENLSLDDPATVDKRDQMLLSATRMRGWGIGTAALGVSTLGVGLAMFVHGKNLAPAPAYNLSQQSPGGSPASDPSPDATSPGTALIPIFSPRGAGIRLIW
jgi:hypothetical protein